MKVKRIIGITMLISVFVFLFIITSKSEGIEITLKAWGSAIGTTAIIVYSAYLCETGNK